MRIFINQFLHKPSIFIIVAVAVLICSTSSFAQLSTFYRDRLRETREREINDALKQGLLTPEQAAAALGKGEHRFPGDVDIPDVDTARQRFSSTSSTTPVQGGIGETPPGSSTSSGGFSIDNWWKSIGATPSLPSFEEQEQMMRAEVERRAATMRPPRITLSQSLDDFISKGRTPDTSYSKLRNYKKARGKIQPYHDLAFQSLSPEKQQNILDRISKNVPIDMAFQTGFGNMVVGAGYELVDMKNRTNWWVWGTGLTGLAILFTFGRNAMGFVGKGGYTVLTVGIETILPILVTVLGIFIFVVVALILFQILQVIFAFIFSAALFVIVVGGAFLILKKILKD